MATARETLFDEVLHLLSQAHDATAVHNLSTIIDKYRIQAKPGQFVSEGQTARETIAAQILLEWQAKGTETPQKLAKIIDHFRMQHKQIPVAGAEKSHDASGTHAPRANVNKKKSAESKKNADVHKVTELMAEDTHKDVAELSHEPVGGGPIKRKSARGQCPKCHSIGVVLARSYTGDEYFSCIYCGYQSFRAGIDTELDLPLAAELLQRKFDDNDQGED